MPTFNQPKTISDVLYLEVLPGWTKDSDVPLSGGAFVLGQVVAKAAGKYVELDPAAVDDTAVAAGVVAEDTDATDDDVVGPVIARGALVLTTGLVWPAGITDNQKALALAQLDARGIKARIPY